MTAKATAAASPDLRHDWTLDEIGEIYSMPMPELVFRAQQVHRAFHAPDQVQTCRLLSIKTGGCPEDCGYCPQSAHYSTGLERESLMDPAVVIAAAHRARSEGVTRFCMGAAWREAPEGGEFEQVLEMVAGIAAEGLEVCCTLGMLNETQAQRLGDAGLTAYNHNLDTSPEFYGQIITTRVYEDRLRTLAAVRKAGITVCCGGIVGMGESERDRIGLLRQLAILDPHPESVPINMLVRVGRHAAAATAAARSAGDGAHDCHRAHSDAAIDGAAGGGPRADVARGSRAVLHGGRELDLRGRKAADHAESRAGRRRAAARRSWLAADGSTCGMKDDGEISARRCKPDAGARERTARNCGARAVALAGNSCRNQSLLERLSWAVDASRAARSRARKRRASGSRWVHRIAIAFGKRARVGRARVRVRGVCWNASRRSILAPAMPRMSAC